VAAKDGSQETAVTLVGLILGLIITPLVEGHYGLIWFLFITFTVAHLFSNYRAVRGLVMDTLNRQRLALVVEHYLNSSNHEILTPAQASHREWPLWFDRFESGPSIRFGAPLASIVPLLPLSSAVSLKQLSAEAPYLVCLCFSTTAALLAQPPDKRLSHEEEEEQVIPDGEAPRIEVLLRRDVSHATLIEAYAAALLARQTVRELRESARRQPGTRPLSLGRLVASVSGERVRLLPSLVERLSARGWHTHRSLLGPGPWRYQPLSSS